MSTNILTPIVKRFGQRVMAGGFRCLLPDIIPEVTTLWKKHEALPLTILSWMPDGVDYWEPDYDGSFQSAAIISLSFRGLARSGLTEALIVNEAWEKDGERRIGEMLTVFWMSRHEKRAYVWHIKEGRRRKYLEQGGEDLNPSVCNPMFCPWNTNTDILDFFQFKDPDRHKMEECLNGAWDCLQRAIPCPASESECHAQPKASF